MTRKVGGIVQPTPWPRWAEAVWPYAYPAVMLLCGAIIAACMLACMGCHPDKMTLFEYHQAGAAVPATIPAEMTPEPTENRPGAIENAAAAPVTNHSIPSNSSPTDSPWWKDPTTIAAILIAGAASVRELRKQWGNAKTLMGKKP